VDDLVTLQPVKTKYAQVILTKFTKIEVTTVLHANRHARVVKEQRELQQTVKFAIIAASQIKCVNKHLLNSRKHLQLF
jgi:uncharacterized membrane protein